MKHSFIITVCITLLSVFVSCSSEDNDSKLDTYSLTDVNSLVVSSDSFFFPSDSILKGWNTLSSQQSRIKYLTRAGGVPMIDSAISRRYDRLDQQGKNYKLLITKKNREYFKNVPAGIYVVQNYTVTDSVAIPLKSSGFIMNSPNCGWTPGGGNYERGYSALQVPKLITQLYVMKTNLVHIVCDINGYNYDLWCPCKPEELEFKYGVIRFP